MAKTLIVASRVKELCKYPGGKKDLNMSSGLSGALTLKVEQIITKACKRAIENGRTTVMIKDI